MNAKYLKRKKDGIEERFYPITHVDAVVDSNGVTIKDQIDDIKDDLIILETELEETKKSVSDGKILVADAITAKGVTTATDATFATMASNISSIDTLTTGTADATATAAQILTGQTAYVKGSKVTGSMVNNGAVAPSALNAGGSYTIPAGYHNGSGKVTVNTLASQTSATATAAQILSGYTAWVNGSKITGTKANVNAASGTVSLTKSDLFGGLSYESFTGTITCGFQPTVIVLNFTSGSFTTFLVTSNGGTMGWAYPNIANTSMGGKSGVTATLWSNTDSQLKCTATATSTGATVKISLTESNSQATAIRFMVETDPTVTATWWVMQ